MELLISGSRLSADEARAVLSQPLGTALQRCEPRAVSGARGVGTSAEVEQPCRVREGDGRVVTPERACRSGDGIFASVRTRRSRRSWNASPVSKATASPER